MQHAPVTPAREDAEPEERLALSAALNRLARLRSPADWSDGPATLVDWANADGESLWGALPEPKPRRRQFDGADELNVAVAFTEDRLVQDEVLPLRGRFAEGDVDTSWVTLADDVAAALIPPIVAPPALPALAPEAPVAESAFIAPAAPAAPAPVTVADDTPVVAYGSMAVALDAPTLEPSPAAPPRTAVEDATPAELLAPGAAPDLAALAALLQCDDEPVATPPAPLRVEPEETLPVGAGAFAVSFDVIEMNVAAAAPAVVTPLPEIEVDVAFGAMSVLRLLDVVPVDEPPLVAVRLFDPESLIDDALAAAFDALLAPAPIPADDVAWDADVAFFSDSPAHALAAFEAALWNLPRHVPCFETFQSNPNHETAVRLTRTLRLRAQTLEARAFAASADFGVLNGDVEASTFWVPADALAEPPQNNDAAEASFPDWQVNADGLIVVVAPDLMAAAPAPAAPVITEEELDALFAHVDEARRVVLDDLGDEPRWTEPYWSDVDSYLAHVAETMDPALLDAPHPFSDAPDLHDLDIRDPEPAPERATHFWMAGDDADLVVMGEGDDIFIVSAGEDASVVLLEDGATWSMRTGGSARMDEVVVSLSNARWSAIDAMPWRRIATLSRVGEVRVEQNAHATRRVMIAGLLSATGLDDENVRLVQSTDDGEVMFPVERPLGDFEAFLAS